ncbi:histone deacetylase family protein, partial|nr:histone deacetylase family protein [Escherichia coli]
TWPAIYGAAQCAIAAADAALAEGHAYALCRPPGHHAYADSAGGFCFLNNSAIAAARMLAATGGPVAILDIDVHHGNGTQGIFYARPDVLTVSVHADPSDYFPFFAGYVDEAGTGEGLGFN